MGAEVTKIILPTQEGTHTGYPAVVGTANKWDAVDPLDPINHDDDTTYNSVGSGGAIFTQSFKGDATFPQANFITAVRTHVYNKRTNSSGSNDFRLVSRYSGTDYYSGSLTYVLNSYLEQYYDFIAARTWIDSDFRSATFEWGIERGNNGPNDLTTSLWTEVDYIPLEVFIEAFREVWSRKLKRSRFEEVTYDLKVPIKFITLELLDDLSVSHFSIPRAESLISNMINDGMTKKWQRLYALNVQQRINLNNMSMVLSFSDNEPYICTFWSTEKLPFAVNEDFDGLAQIDVGSLRSFTRNSNAWVTQNDGQVVTVEPGREKMNHVGFITDEQRTTQILNSNFQDGIASIWTTVLNGGTVANDTSTLLFKDSANYPNSALITRGAGGETFLRQGGLTIDGLTSFRTATFDYLDDGTGGRTSWWLQRSTDSWWWNDTTEAWQNTRAENRLPLVTSIDGDNRAVSKPIIEAAAATWTIEIGISTTGTSSGDVVNIFQVDLVEGPYVVERIVTDNSATVTTERDEKKFVLDSSGETQRQIWPSDRGTNRLTYRPSNDGSRLQDGDKLALAYGQIGDTSNYGYVTYQKLVGENVRFAFERYEAATLISRATKEISVVRNTEYEIAARWTSDDNELDLITEQLDHTAFDGTNDTYTLAGDFTGNADDTTGFFSCLVRFNDVVSQQKIFESASAKISVEIVGGKLRILGRTSVPVTIINIGSVMSFVVDTWYLIVATWDTANVNNTHLYINNIETLSVTTNNAGTIDYTSPPFEIAGRSSDALFRLNGDLSQVWFNPGTNLNISDKQYLRLFIAEDGSPVPLGKFGQLPLGTAPLVYFPDGNGTRNRGSAQNMTEVGSPTAGFGPDASFVPEWRSMTSIFVDGVKGTDALSRVMDSTKTDSELWLGSSPSALSDLTSMGAISNVEVVQRVLADEEILGRR
jgi:hypothetical protein